MTEDSQITVRLALADDIDAIAWIYGECFGGARPREAVEQYLGLQGSWALLATMGGAQAMTPAGFVLARTVLDETEVFSVGVVSLYRRLGVGETLMEGTRRIASLGGARAIFLEVGADNPQARALYEQAGYKTVGHRSDYYKRDDGNCVDAIVMRLSIGKTDASNS
ncbi:MAG: GNAT family N-acetyltransferase [Alphaproteobacteria bacterium]